MQNISNGQLSYEVSLLLRLCILAVSWNSGLCCLDTALFVIWLSVWQCLYWIIVLEGSWAPVGMKFLDENRISCAGLGYLYRFIRGWCPGEQKQFMIWIPAAEAYSNYTLSPMQYLRHLCSCSLGDVLPPPLFMILHIHEEPMNRNRE